MQRNELNAERVEFGQRVHQLTDASGEPVVTVNRDHVEEAPSTIGEKLVQLRPPLLRTADANVGKHGSDVPAASFAQLSKFANLRRNAIEIEHRREFASSSHFANRSLCVVIQFSRSRRSKYQAFPTLMT